MKLGSGELQRAFRMAKWTSIAIVVSVFIYAVVVEWVKYARAPFEGFTPGVWPVMPLRVGLAAIAVANAMAIPFMRRKILEDSPRRKTPPAGAASPFIGRLTTANLISFALAEAVAIYGLVIFLISGSSADFYGFFVFSLILFGMYFPRYEKWEEYVGKQGRTGTGG